MQQNQAKEGKIRHVTGNKVYFQNIAKQNYFTTRHTDTFLSDLQKTC